MIVQILAVIILNLVIIVTAYGVCKVCKARRERMRAD